LLSNMNDEQDLWDLRSPRRWQPFGLNDRRVARLIVRYAMTLCPEACCSGRVSIATAIDFILAGLYCERLSIAT